MPRCGTFGCTLPNNHRGLHKLPQEEASRKRRRPHGAGGPEQVRADGSLCEENEESNGMYSDGKEALGMDAVMREEAEIKAEGAGAEGTQESEKPPSPMPTRRESSGRKRMPSVKLREEVRARL